MSRPIPADVLAVLRQHLGHVLQQLKAAARAQVAAIEAALGVAG